MEKELKNDGVHCDIPDVLSLHDELRTSPRVVSTNGFLGGTRFSIFTFIASRLPLAKAAFSMKRCCTLAVRQDFQTYIAESYPWQVCNLNEDINFSDNVTYPSIMRSMSWARQYCWDAQYSNLNQWLQPLCTYVSPYIGILLICPVGDVTEYNLTAFSSLKWLKWVNAAFNRIRDPLQEYLSILGDPVSATFGVFHEIWSDVQTMRRVPINNAPSLPMQHRALYITTLMGDIGFINETAWLPNVLDSAKYSGKQAYQTQLKDTPTSGKNAEEDAEVQNDGIYPAETGTKPQTTVPSSTAINEVDRAIDIVITARTGFGGGVLIPVLLMLAVTAATFYGAYGNMGDKDTALALAYCVWYSWILVVGVGGNCFANSLNSDLARKAFENVLNFGKNPVSVPMRDRFVNSQLWDAWATSAVGNHNLDLDLAKLKRDWRVWLWFCLGQFLGFCSVAFSSACATAIAWTTPTTGLGCRSFNFILYAVLSFAVSYLHVLCSWLKVRSRTRKTNESNLLLLSLQCIYWVLVLLNSMVVVLGTILHLVGVFRACWCERLTWSNSTLIELNSKTPQAVENAKKYWISTSYIAFGVVWLICLLAIVCRSFIFQKMGIWQKSRQTRRPES